MKRKKLLPLLILPIFSASFLVSPVFAEDPSASLSNDQIGNISTNCSSIKETLKRAQNSDRNTRLSLGRIYQNVLTNFITPLNVRLVKNNLFDSSLADNQSSFSKNRETFNHDYVTYSKDLETLIATDCKTNPVDFYSQLEKTRASRKAVSNDIATLNNILLKHSELVVNLKNTVGVTE